MSTNFYYHTGDTNHCTHCGRCDKNKVLHIGLCAGGWAFSLRVHPEEGINSLDDWKARWATGHIEDEYGRRVTVETMLDTITNRGGSLRHHTRGKDDPSYPSWPGENGGTWDYCNYDFS